MGAKPVTWTPKDKRLKGNKPAPKPSSKGKK
jgi:hypothetical protein